MNISLIDLDSKIPNLALMKISSYHKSKGDKVLLNAYDNPEKVYISCIFDKNKYQALGISTTFNCELIMGGYGVNNNKLDPKIEHIKPDYSLYNIDYSMGFTSRGCIRNCDFCIVPKNEGKIKDHAEIKEFLDPKHKKLILLDNNFLASPKCDDNIKFIKDNKLTVNFCQGLDIRLINDNNSKLLSDLKISNRKFNGNQIHFAYDSIKYSKSVIRGIEKLEEYGIKPYRLMFYVLCGFNTDFKDDYFRFNLLKTMGCDPYIMLYNGGTPLLKHFARWVNTRIYKSCEFKDYNRLSLSQKTKINNNSLGIPL